MSFLYSIDPEKKRAYLILPEKTNLAETLETLRELAADERLGEEFHILIDVRATSFIPTAREAREIAWAISNPALFLRRPIAVIVSQLVQYGMGNMVSLIAGLKGIVLRVFYEVEEAEAWLKTVRR
jgi:hypothetical protein